jgi:hypothetical protein
MVYAVKSWVRKRGEKEGERKFEFENLLRAQREEGKRTIWREREKEYL